MQSMGAAPGMLMGMNAGIGMAPGMGNGSNTMTNMNNNGAAPGLQPQPGTSSNPQRDACREKSLAGKTNSDKPVRKR